jgi:hypothetical protein
LKLFNTSGHLDRPPVVPEVPTNLAHHGRHSERQEVRPVVDVEAVDGVDQTESRRLDEIVKWFTPAAVPAGDVISQRQTAVRDCFVLTPISRRSGGERSEMSDHLGDF